MTLSPTQENQTPETDESKDPAWYREQMAKKDQQVAEARTAAKHMLFTTFGIDVTKKGLGQTMYEQYDGPISQPEFAAWAKDRYDWSPPDPETTAGRSEIRDGAAEVVQGAESRANDLEGASISGANIEGQHDDHARAIREAQERGDWASVITLETNRFRNKILGE